MTRQKKIFTAERGVALDPYFGMHIHDCEQCSRYKPSEPATLALLCLEGSVLWKRENKAEVEKKAEYQNPNQTSKAEAKKLMRYK